MNTLAAVATGVAAVLAILGMISRVVGRVVRGITALIAETKDNTEAVKSVGEKLDSNVTPVLADHENRITKIEGKIT